MSSIKANLTQNWDRLRRKIDMLSESTDPHVVAGAPDLLADLASAATAVGIYAMEIAAQMRNVCEEPSVEARNIADAMMGEATVTRTLRRKLQEEIGQVKHEPQYSEG